MRTAIIEFSAYSGWSVRLFRNGVSVIEHEIGFSDLGFMACKLIANQFVIDGSLISFDVSLILNCKRVHSDIALLEGIEVSMSAYALPQSAGAKGERRAVRRAGGLA